MAINDIINDSWQGHSHGEVEQALKDKIQEIEQAMEELSPGDTIGYNQLSSDVKQLLEKARNALQSNDIAGWAKAANKPSYNANEIGGVEGFANLLAKLQAMDNAMNNKANDADVVKSISVNGTPQTKDTNGNVNLNVQDGEDGITPHIGQDGYWYTGSTSTGVKARGPQGPSGVSSADEVVVVNDLDGDPSEMEEGQVAVLSAEMGKELAEMIDEIGDGGSTLTIEGDTLVITDNTSPILRLTPSALHFSDTLFGQTATKNISVSGKSLTGNVTIALTGSGFSANKQTLAPDVDGIINDTIIITFAPTGSGEDVEYSGELTATHGGVQMASVEIDGTGVAAIVPSLDVTMDGDDVSAIALKGVLSSTAEGDYSDAPSKATIHIEAKNISNGVTLALTSGTKFALSKNSLTAEEALAGADIVVSYNRQAAVTQTDDTDTLTISCQDITGSTTIGLSGATGAMPSLPFDVGSVHYQTSSIGICASANTNNPPTGELVLKHLFSDEYGYTSYLKNSVATPLVLNGLYDNAFKGNTAITSVTLEDGIYTMFSQSFLGCTSLKSAKLGSITNPRSSLFAGCTSLEVVDLITINIGSYNAIFVDSAKLSSFIFRSTTMVSSSDVKITNFYTGSVTIDGVQKTVCRYKDDNNVYHQTKLYVPSSLVQSYKEDSFWGDYFDVQAIEGSIYEE